MKQVTADKLSAVNSQVGVPPVAILAWEFLIALTGEEFYTLFEMSKYFLRENAKNSKHSDFKKFKESYKGVFMLIENMYTISGSLGYSNFEQIISYLLPNNIEHPKLGD